MSEFRNAACAYIERNWAVIPLQANSKLPDPALTPNGLVEASKKPGDIFYWWERSPSANVAIVCRDSGLVVLDVDVRHNGFTTLDELENELGLLPRGLVAWTPTGGEHLIFANPDKLDFKKEAGPGVDIKDRGYIVAPPSKRKEGRYEWRTAGPIVPLLPPAWVEHCTRPERAQNRPLRRSNAPLLQIPAEEYVSVLTGREANGGGWVQCPWHKDGEERTPSMRCNDSLWACFVCEPFGGKQMCGGNVVDFAGKLWGYALPLAGADLAEVLARLEKELC